MLGIGHAVLEVADVVVAELHAAARLAEVLWGFGLGLGASGGVLVEGLEVVTGGESAGKDGRGEGGEAP